MVQWPEPVNLAICDVHLRVAMKRRCHVDIEGNEKADHNANLTTMRVPEGIKLPITDFYSSNEVKINKSWRNCLKEMK